MKKSALYIIASIVLLLNSCVNNYAKDQLAAADFDAKIKELPKSILIDVRTPDEYSKGHLPNAVNMDWNDGAFDDQVSKLDKTQPVFVYCLSGARSGAAATKMRTDGFVKVYELSGGIMKWRGANLPETTETTAAKPAGMTNEQFSALLNSDKLVLIDFYADWCGPCKKMKPYLEEISSDMKDKVEVIRINADDNQDLCNSLKIDALPTLYLYKNKQLAWSNVGYIEKADVVAKLK